jgi:hypothetical protein
MTLRRVMPLTAKPSATIAPVLRERVRNRDRLIVGGNGCVGRYVGMTGFCGGSMELDHVRASHAMGMKSETVAKNLATLCGVHHRMKTENGRHWRPMLIEYLDRSEP